ncbi:hypothetical protein Pint_15392 [Pistacia integerrima]|uniref:Uncharacterized protein n=1 Tax=Pistacia integerrima TaxID=434235 RepID=A0ACC0ZG21_9ROSI|nr:hypothetical protein Pint_15392 [Pistacia integerrima]
MRMRMHGWRAGEEEDHQRKRHMWTVPPRGSQILDALAHGAASPSSSPPLSSSPNSTTFFSQDGRKISVGDCALFKPPQHSPPFIGIIRSVTAGEENKLTLSVNWLYRLAELKLGKGFPMEAAPNEIFYSFHKDEIPAASLLHPCKVAFLPKGVELPSGIGSFVCRKVYDITKQCLWWLTDKDYMTDRQEEIDQLLYKTRVEMHATVPPGGRSPKPMNGPTSTSQLKPGSDSVQNSASSFPSQVKGKKRERGDQGCEPVKRERSSRMEDGDSGHNRMDSLKSEIAKFTDKGGLVDYDGVEKLVQLMTPEKKIDLVCRSMLAGVVAGTEKFDCLNWFVQLKGLPVYDEWLQEVHKGKIGDGNSPKDGDKSIEEFLLILLRALDKLPINLRALQMCNIGKSVNHLRAHKNLEIQKKARSLVDTWKKRVEAEMDATPNQAVSWPAGSRLPEVTPGGNRQSGGSSEVAVKSLVQPTASKIAAVKPVSGEPTTKSAFASPVSVKSAPSPTSVGTNLKDGQSRNSVGAGATDLPSTPAKDEKSSSAGQSHNNSQSCSIDHAKTGGLSGKEDARSSTSVSVAANEASAGSLRSRKSVNGLPGSNLSGVHRETGSNRTSQHRNQASERPSQSSLTSEKAIDVPIVEGSNHKLIVKIPNRGRSPAQSASAGSLEDPPVTNSRASSPVLSEKHDQFDRNLKERNDALVGADEGDGAPSVAPDEEGCRTGDDTKAFTEISKDASSPSGNEHKNTKRQQIPFSALIKYSEVASAPVGDDIGMNLLASVAAGEMGKSDVVSPPGSPQRNTPVHEQVCDDNDNDSRVKSSPGADLSREQSQSIDGADDEHEKQVDCTLSAKNADINQEKSARDSTGHINISPMDLPQTRNSFPESYENLKQEINEEISDAAAKDLEGKADSRVDVDGSPGALQKMSSSLLTVDKVSEPGVKVETEALEVSSSYQSSEIDGENKKNVNDGFNNSIQTEQKLSPVVKHFDFVKATDVKVPLTSGHGKDMTSENVDAVKAENADEVDVISHLSDSEKQKTEWRSKAPVIHDDPNEPNSGLAVSDQKCERIEETVECKEVKGHHCAGPAPPEASPALQVLETGQHVRPGEPKLTGGEGDEAEVSSSTTADESFSAAGITDMEAKVEFDLNEGFNGDDGKYGESNHLTAPECSGTVQQLISPLPFPVSPVSSSLPASITESFSALPQFFEDGHWLIPRGRRLTCVHSEDGCVIDIRIGVLYWTSSGECNNWSNGEVPTVWQINQRILSNGIVDNR